MLHAKSLIDSNHIFFVKYSLCFFYLLTSGLQQLIQLLCQLLQHIIVLNTNQVNELDVLITALNSEDLNGFKFEKAIESINEIHADAGL
jgi:DeoR/GlpR family transcriptional regulator of sugar metabolism